MNTMNDVRPISPVGSIYGLKVMNSRKKEQNINKRRKELTSGDFFEILTSEIEKTKNKVR